MNCQELKRDIEKLEDLYSRFKNKYELSSESGLGKIELTNISNEANENVDEILERYLPDFKEHNPELFGWQIGERIEDFGRDDVYRISVLPDGGVFMTGYGSAVHYATRNQDGGWDIKKRIGGFDKEMGIRSISALSDDDVLIGGRYLHHAIKKDGGFDVELIGEFGDGIEHANSLLPLPDGRIIVGGDRGTLGCVTKESNSWNIEVIGELKDEDGEVEGIESILALPDGDILIIGMYRSLKCATKNQDGSWKLDDKIGRTPVYPACTFSLPDGRAIIAGFQGDLLSVQRKQGGDFSIETIDNPQTRIGKVRAISVLPDGNILIGGTNGILYNAMEKQGGGLSFEPISTLYNVRNEPGTINAISQLPDGTVLIGGNDGLLFHATPPIKDAKTMRRHLNELINKDNQ